jgi:hypothetical protein
VDTSKLPPTPAGAPPHENAVLAWAPPDSFTLATGTDLGVGLKQLLDQLEKATPGLQGQLDMFGVGAAIDSLSGDFGVIVGPGRAEPVAGAVAIGTDDETVMQDFLDGISALISQSLASSLEEQEVGGPPAVPSESDLMPLGTVLAPPTWRTEEYEGVTISYLPLPDPDATAAGMAPAYAVTDGIVLIATSPDQIKKLIGTASGPNITSTSNYEAAIAHGEPNSPDLVYVDLENILDVVGAQGGPEGAMVALNLEPLKAIVMTSGGTDVSETATVFILIQ